MIGPHTQGEPEDEDAWDRGRPWRYSSCSGAAPPPRSRWTRASPRTSRSSGVSGNISSVGSDTLNNLMTLWAERFAKFYPNAKVQIEGKGSSTAPPALIAGTAQLGPMSREMKGTRDRPVREEVRLQADRAPHLGRRAGRVREQGQPDQVPDPRPGRRDLLEVAPPRRQGGHHDLGPARPHRRVGQQADQPLRPQLGLRHLRLLQGARAQERRLQGHGEGAAGLRVGGAGRRPSTGSPSATAASATRPPACARCRSPRRTAASASRPTADNAYTGSYPLARFLYVYVNKAPGKPLDPLTREFVQADALAGGPGSGRQGRLLPDPGLHRQGRAEQGPVGGDQRRRAAGRPARLVVSRARTARRILLDRLGLAPRRARRPRHHRLDPRHPVRDPRPRCGRCSGRPRPSRVAQALAGGRAGAGRGARRGRVPGDRVHDHRGRGAAVHSAPRRPAPTRRSPVPGLDGARVTAVADDRARPPRARHLGRPRGAARGEVRRRVQGRHARAHAAAASSARRSRSIPTASAPLLRLTGAATGSGPVVGRPGRSRATSSCRRSSRRRR